MSERAHDEIRRGRYSPERLLMLIDGIFAISMTLLVLDVGIREGVPDTVAGFDQNLSDLLRKLGIFVAAFLITSRFWLVNHRQLALLHTVDEGVAKRALLFLVGITSLPAITGVLFRFGDVAGAVTLAALVLAVTAALSARLWWYISSPERDLADVDEDDRRRMMIRSGLVVVAYLLAIPIAYLLPPGDAAYAALVWLVLAFVDRLAGRLHQWLAGRARSAAPR